MNEAEPLLIEFENALADIYLTSRGDLGVIAFSDHGNDQTLSRGSPVEDFLTARGWRVRGSIEGPRDIVIPAYGLVGFAAIYCRPAAIEPLAEQLRALEGADVIVSRHPDQANAVTIRSARSTRPPTCPGPQPGPPFRSGPPDIATSCSTAIPWASGRSSIPCAQRESLTRTVSQPTPIYLPLHPWANFRTPPREFVFGPPITCRIAPMSWYH